MAAATGPANLGVMDGSCYTCTQGMSSAACLIDTCAMNHACAIVLRVHTNLSHATSSMQHCVFAVDGRNFNKIETTNETRYTFLHVITLVPNVSTIVTCMCWWTCFNIPLKPSRIKTLSLAKHCVYGVRYVCFRNDGLHLTAQICMMMIAFITFNSSLVPLIKGLGSSNPWKFELSGLDGIEPMT